MNVTQTDFSVILPALCAAVGALAVVAFDLFRRRDAKNNPAEIIALAAIGTALGNVILKILRHESDLPLAFGGAVGEDLLSLFLSLGILAAALMMVLLSPEETLRRKGMPFGEFNALVLASTAGMLLLVQSRDFITLFISLEIVSLCVYALSGFLRTDPRSNEASVKYFVTGAFATGFLLYGMALLYGATGEVSLAAIAERLGAPDATDESLKLAKIGVALLVAGLLFKVGAVPFHMWLADVYEGAPTSVTAYMSVTVKAAGFGALIRILLTAVPTQTALWGELIYGAALATMVVGNLLALKQRNVKRMLAWSSVAHTGYVLVGLASLWQDGALAARDVLGGRGGASVFYLFAYVFMTLGAFTVVIFAGRDGKDAEDLDDYAGLAKKRPWTAAAMTVFMVSLAGIPPTAGFFGKFLLLRGALDAGHVTLVIIGVLMSAVSVYYYLRVVVAMFMRPEVSPKVHGKPATDLALVVGASALFTVLLGIFPPDFMELSVRSIASLFGS